MKRNGAKLIISTKGLAELLGFRGGHIHHIQLESDYWDRISITMEHPDLPEVNTGDMLSTVEPTIIESWIQRLEPERGLRQKLHDVADAIRCAWDGDFTRFTYEDFDKV